MTNESITAVCHVRAPLLLEPIDRQVETLRACETEGTIDELLLRSWPKEVAIDDANPHQEVLETFDRFREWADRREVSIEPPFTRRTTTSQMTGETTELLVTPLLCLEVYVDDELVGIFPHSGDDETYTTNEAIATLRSGGLPTPFEEDLATETSRPGECPDCGGSLVDGQGLFACSSCGWTGIIEETGQYVPQMTPGTEPHRPRTIPE